VAAAAFVVGLLKPLTSRWRVETLEGTWAVISFSPTLFTPAGVDVIAREAIDEAGVARAREFLEKTAHLAQWVPRIRATAW
jgi:hypothetical protein